MAKGWTLPRREDGTVDTDGGFVQLPPGHFVPAKMPLQITYPRPDGETATTARHRHLYPNLPYRIPICVQGGAAPFGFRFGANHTLPGSNIGGFLTASGDKYVVGDDYGVLNGTAPASGTYTVHVEVLDQDGGTVKADIEWQVTVSADNFVFADFNAGGSNAGTIDSPFTDQASVWGANTSDVVNAGKIVYFRGGTHNLTGQGSGYTIHPRHTNNPAVILEYPGETVIFDMKTASNGTITGCRFSMEQSNDLYFGKIIFDGNHTTASGSGDAGDYYQFHAFQNPFHRVTFFESTFRNWQRHAGGIIGSNPAVMYVLGGQNVKTYFNMSRITMDGATNGAMTLYNIHNSVFEHFRVQDITDCPDVLSNSNGFIYLKDRPGNVSVRFGEFGRNVGYGGIQSPVKTDEYIGPTQNVEVCYNKFWGAQNYAYLGVNLPQGTIWVYRNNGTAHIAANLGDTGHFSEKNIVTDPNDPAFNITNSTDNYSLVNPFDANLDLIDRVTHLGLRGAEVAGNG